MTDSTAATGAETNDFFRCWEIGLISPMSAFLHLALRGAYALGFLPVDLFELLVGHAPNLLPRALVDDPPVLQADDTGSVTLHEVEIVEAADHRHTVLLVQLF